MTTQEIELEYEDYIDDETPNFTPEEAKAIRDQLFERCKSAELKTETTEYEGDDPTINVALKCGREVRWVSLWDTESVLEFLSTKFEDYVFLSNLEAICSYSQGKIEVGLIPANTSQTPIGGIFRRIFSVAPQTRRFDIDEAKIEIPKPQPGMPSIEISGVSEEFKKISRSRAKISMKLTECHITNHDQAVKILKKVSDSLLFQLDMEINIPLIIERERRSAGPRFLPKRRADSSIEYPKYEYDNAPLSLYWYARSASGMPLLQFLAFYQVIEFYFSSYSQSEATRKVQSILKNPTFRIDRDTDIAKLLSTIQSNRSGTFGDERSQLRATIMECVNADEIREFLISSDERKEFYLASKNKSGSFHKIPIGNSTADLRGDVAERIYDIRCKIVHTKSDFRDGEFEILLPFSKEAEQLLTDIDLVKFIAQSVLINSSTPFNAHN